VMVGPGDNTAATGYVTTTVDARYP